MPLKSVAKFAGGLGFSCVSIWLGWWLHQCSRKSYKLWEGSAFSCNTDSSFWTLFKTSQETVSLISRLNLSGWSCYPMLFLHFSGEMAWLHWAVHNSGWGLLLLSNGSWQQGCSKILCPQTVLTSKLWFQWALAQCLALILSLCLHRLVLCVVW